MRFTQFLIIEICRECHHGAEHKQCPNTHPDRFALSAGHRPVTDDQIVAIVRESYTEHGFTGLVGWHYYNDPLCAWWRLRPLMARIRREVPAARFLLWTNGEQLPVDVRDLDVFEQIHVTNYRELNLQRVLGDRPGVRVWKSAFDRRLDAPQRQGQQPCVRQFVELIVDLYGNLHSCCYDWRGEVTIGNMHDSSWAALVQKWQSVRRNIAGAAMTGAAPARCLHCGMRNEKIPSFETKICEAAVAYRDRMIRGVPEPLTPIPAAVNIIGESVWVVAVAYRIPAERVRAFCTWNRDAFQALRARVVIVVEQPYDGLPPDVLQVPYDKPMRVFNIAATKNTGIRVALAAGAGVIVASDIDLVLPLPVLQVISAVPEKQAGVPLYRMAESYEARESKFVDAPKATGTVAMRAADWARVKYDERCEGYGCDDAVLLVDAQKAGVAIAHRDLVVYHVAHKAGTPQKEFCGRADHWNRDTGFNPENFAANGAVFRDKRGSAE